MLLNFGVCAGVNVPCGDLYLCSKLTELETGRTFYPDMLYRHPFGEAALVTGRNIWTGSRQDKMQLAEGSREAESATLYDMEAAAIYQAASYYVGPHRMQFLKLVSDNGTGNEANTGSNAEIGACVVGQEHNTRVSSVTPAAIRQRIQAHEPEIFAYMDWLIAFVQQETEKTKSVSENDNPWFERLCADLHCSKVMGDELWQQLYYQELSGNCYEKILQGMYAEGLLPCKDKREGKKCLEELKRRFL
jgi:hypothetical protein